MLRTTLRATGASSAWRRAPPSAASASRAFSQLRAAREPSAAASSSLARMAGANAAFSQLRLSAKPSSHWDRRGETKAVAFWTSAALAAPALWLAASNDGDAQCASSSSKKGDDDRDLLAQAQEKLKGLATDALAAASALIPAEMADLQGQVNTFLASGKGGQISWGFLMGVCSGFALKKVSKVGAIALGGLFVLLQCASYSGYIDVNYQKLQRDMTDYLDLNRDGVLDTKDLDSLYKSVMKVLEFSLPAGSGYAAGFLVGFRAG